MPSRANVDRYRASARGVSTATGTVAEKVRPVLVTRVTVCGSPATQGYGIASRRLSSRPIVRGPSIEWTQLASSTKTWATVTASGPPLTTCTSRRPTRGITIRSIVNSSTGGNACWKTPIGPAFRKSATTATSSTSGPTPSTQRGSPPRGAGRAGRGAGASAGGSRRAGSDTRRLLHVEDPCPSELGELALVRVEHEGAGMLVHELEHRSLALRQCHRVGVLVPLEVGARAVEPEEVAVQVERVEQVELGDVHEIDPRELAQPKRDRMLLVVERDGIDCVDLVLAVEVRVEPVHHHHQLVRRGAAALRVDDEDAVKSLVDVPLDRHRVAVIELQPRGLRVELVDEIGRA